LRADYALNLRVLRRESRHGAHESRADGARIAIGLRVLFLDDDVIPEVNVLLNHASDTGHFAVGSILYHEASIVNLYGKLQARRYEEYYRLVVNRSQSTREIETWQICNASGPAKDFSQFLDAVHDAMQGIPVGGEGFDESIMHIEATRRGYRFDILPDAIVWHVDTRSLDDARRGRRRNGRIACQLALQPARRDPEIDRIFDIAGVLSGRQGFSKMSKAKLVWKAPFVMDFAADVLTLVADKGPKRWLPSGLCKLPLSVAFWQGVRDEAPSWERLKTNLARGD